MNLTIPEAEVSTTVICSFLLGTLWELFLYDLLQGRHYHLLEKSEGKVMGEADWTQPLWHQLVRVGFGEGSEDGRAKVQGGEDLEKVSWRRHQ